MGKGTQDDQNVRIPFLEILHRPVDSLHQSFCCFLDHSCIATVGSRYLGLIRRSASPFPVSRVLLLAIVVGLGIFREVSPTV